MIFNKIAINLKIKKNRPYMKDFKKYDKGSIFSIDILIILIISILIMGITANILDYSNEKALDSIERSNLEQISNEIIDGLIKSPGVPDYWEKTSNYNNIIPGLAIKKEKRGTIVNSVSYMKILALSKNYGQLIDDKVFHGDIKSSIAIYPLNSKIPTLKVGNSDENMDLVNNIVVAKRLVKCDFLSDFTILSINGEEFKQKNTCINTLNNESSHKNTSEYSWICESFSTNQDNLDNMNYYLLFTDDTIGSNSYWSLSSSDNLTIDLNNILTNSYNINNKIQSKLGNSNEKQVWIHFKVSNNIKNEFEVVLVTIPKELDVEELLVSEININHFKVQDSIIELKTWF
jgi:hypothetical protein